MKKVAWIVALSTSFSTSMIDAAELSALAQVNHSISDNSTSFFNKGTDILRFDDTEFNQQQTVLRIKQDVGSSFTLDVVANYY